MAGNNRKSKQIKEPEQNRTTIKSSPKQVEKITNQDDVYENLAELAVDKHRELLANAKSNEQRADLMLRLQQSHGNAYVQRLLDSQAVQAKLTVNQPGDRYEIEADQVAERITQNLKSNIQRQAAEEEEEVQTKPMLQHQVEEEEEEVQTKPMLQRQAVEEEDEVQTKLMLQRQAEEEEEEVQTKPMLQRQAEEEEEVQAKSDHQPLQVSSSFEAKIDTDRGNGQPLPLPVRASLEPEFEHDFSDVRIHNDSKADGLSQQLSARAFTTRNDIFFRTGEYNPESRSGLKLLAHELTHTLQQGISNRIAGWFPKGHRLITELAAKNFKEFYDERALKFLAGRSPDMDFKESATSDYKKGKEASKTAFKEYKKLLDSGKKDDARKMYEENKLHVRPPEYQNEHGEGGHYKESGADTNASMTNKLVSKAVETWPKDHLESMVILSDALHQAEDRGSHGEGNPFDGHDARLALYQQPWEKAHYKPGWQPDNAAMNSRGAALALGHAEKVLTTFKNRLNMPKGKKIAIAGFFGRIKEFFKPKRRMGGLIKSSNPLSKIIGDTGLGVKDGLEKMSAIIETALGDKDTKVAYEKAKNIEEQKKILNQRIIIANGNPDEQHKLVEEMQKVLPKRRPLPKPPVPKRRK